MSEPTSGAPAQVEERAVRREVLARLAHDLRNPLNLINTALALLDGGIPDSERPRVLGWVRSGVEQMSRMLRDQLELARLQDGSLASEAAPVALDEVLADVATAAAARAEVRVVAEPGLVVRADRRQLATAVARLVEHLVGAATSASVTLGAAREREGVRVAVRAVGGDGRVAAGGVLPPPQAVPKPAELPLALGGAALARHGAELVGRTLDDGVAELSFRLPLASL